MRDRLPRSRGQPPPGNEAAWRTRDGVARPENFDKRNNPTLPDRRSAAQARARRPNATQLRAARNLLAPRWSR
jgi:hypothetical protein